MSSQGQYQKVLILLDVWHLSILLNLSQAVVIQ